MTEIATTEEVTRSPEEQAQFDANVANAKMLSAGVIEAVEQANGIATKVKQATEGVESQINAYLEESDDDTVTQFRGWAETVNAEIKKLQDTLKENTAKIEEYAREAIGANTDFDVEAAKAEYMKLRSEVTAKRKALAVFFDSDVLDAVFGETVELIGFRGATKGGPSVPRPRLASASINGTPVEDPKFSRIAAILKDVHNVTVKTGDLTDAALKAAGVSVWNEARGVQTFEYEDNMISWEPLIV